jgi:hypothetical protein
MSGESLRAMIVRARWMVTVVAIWRGGASSAGTSGTGCDQPSS